MESGVVFFDSWGEVSQVDLFQQPRCLAGLLKLRFHRGLNKVDLMRVAMPWIPLIFCDV
jgi:hypothetical protein